MNDCHLKINAQAKIVENSCSLAQPLIQGTRRLLA